jgi:hypothetical protein
VLSSGIKARTVNMEVGLLRRIMKRQKQWARLAEDVRNLPERPTPIHILSPRGEAQTFSLRRGSKPAGPRRMGCNHRRKHNYEGLRDQRIAVEECRAG